MSDPEYESYTLHKSLADQSFGFGIQMLIVQSSAKTVSFPFFGFAIKKSEGTDQMVTDQLGPVTISDVEAYGPAVGKLQIGDKLIMVQNNSCVGMTFEDCVNLIKNADNTISISVERNFESYKGDIVDGKRHGKGLLIYKSGCSYEGNFFKNKKTGKGKYFDETGTLRYEGDFVDGVWSGKGRLFFRDGRLIYDGDFVDGIWNGKGKLFDINGNLKYEGNLVDNKANGKGKCFHENGNLEYEGDFVDDFPNGKGKYFYENGNLKYDGDVVNGNFHGTGKLLDANGNLSYEGDFVNGTRNQTYL